MKRGQFEQADGGTLFLDEIGDMSLNTQAKVLRALQEQQFTRVGGTKLMKVDVRVLAASNKDLEKEIGKGQFREDLYYRLNVVPIVVPPLRERREDIPALVQHFMKTHVEEQGLRMKDSLAGGDGRVSAVRMAREHSGAEEFDRAAHDHGAGVCDRSLPGHAVVTGTNRRRCADRQSRGRTHFSQNPTIRFGTPGMRSKKSISVANFGNTTGIFHGPRKISRSSEAISTGRSSCSMWRCGRRAEEDGDRISARARGADEILKLHVRGGPARTRSGRPQTCAQDGRFYTMGRRVSVVVRRRYRAASGRAR